MEQESTLKLLKFPNKIDDINQYRLEQILESLEAPEYEHDAIEGVLVALYNYLSTLEDTEHLLRDITRFRAVLGVFFDNE